MIVETDTRLERHIEAEFHPDISSNILSAAVAIQRRHLVEALARPI